MFLIPPGVQVTDAEKFTSWLCNFNSWCVHDAKPCPWLPRAKRAWRKSKETAGATLVLAEAVCSECSIKWDLGACRVWYPATTSPSLTRTWVGDTAEGFCWWLWSAWYFQHFIAEVCSLEKLWVCLIKKWSLNTSQDLVFYCRGIACGNSWYYLSHWNPHFQWKHTGPDSTLV